jgi:hypothetical protein
VTAGLASLSLADTDTVMDRPSIAAGTDEVPSPSEADLVLGADSEPPAPYYALTAHRCQCLAVFKAANANAIDKESQLAGGGRQECDIEKLGASEMQARMLAYHAIRERNMAAAKALRLFYRLAEAEATRDVLLKSRDEIDKSIADYDQLIAQGMELQLDGDALRQKRNDLLDSLAQADQSVEELDSGLRVLLGADSCDRTAIWPLAELDVIVAPVDVEGVVAEGLAQNADLCAMRLVAQSVEVSCLPVVRGAMSQINPLLGSAPIRNGPLMKLLGIAAGRQERDVRRQQMCELLRQKKHDVEEQIRRAAAGIETKLRQIAVARQKYNALQDRLADLTARRDADGVTPFDVSQAQLQLYQAERDLIAKVVGWKLAEVDLKEAQGVLPLECGVELPCACSACQ